MAGRKAADEPVPAEVQAPTAGSLWQMAAAKSSHVSLSAVFQQVMASERHLDQLVLEGRYAEAAALCPAVLHGSAAKWEWWVNLFLRHRQLPLILPVIPTTHLLLSNALYTKVLVELLLSPHDSDHHHLVTLVFDWPVQIYDAPAVAAALSARLQEAPQSLALRLALGLLFTRLKQFSSALPLFLVVLERQQQLHSQDNLMSNRPSSLRQHPGNGHVASRPGIASVEEKAPGASKAEHKPSSLNSYLPDIFAFVADHGLVAQVEDKVPLLFSLSSSKAAALLADSYDAIPPPSVARQLSHAHWLPDGRHCLYEYLHAVFLSSPDAAPDMHQLMVELYADFDRAFLLTFLRTSDSFPLQPAYDACLQRGLWEEGVFLLTRMGDAKAALALMLQHMPGKDVSRALSFAHEVNDAAVWEELQAQAATNAHLASALMKEAADGVDMQSLLHSLPSNMNIPSLRNLLSSLLCAAMARVSLSTSCLGVLQGEAHEALQHLIEESARGAGFGSRMWYPDDVAVLDDANDHPAKSNDAHVPSFGGDETENADDDDSWAAYWEGGPDGGGSQQPVQQYQVVQEFSEAQDVMEMEKWRETGGASRGSHGPCCAICLEPLSSKREVIVAFFCRHSFHSSCLSGRSVLTDAGTHSAKGLMSYLHKELELTPNTPCILCSNFGS